MDMSLPNEFTNAAMSPRTSAQSPTSPSNGERPSCMIQTFPRHDTVKLDEGANTAYDVWSIDTCTNEVKFIRFQSSKLPIFKLGRSADLRRLFGWDPRIFRLRCLMAFEDLSLSFKMHFESLDFEFGSSSYDHFSEDCACRISEWDYDGNYEFQAFNSSNYGDFFFIGASGIESTYGYPCYYKFDRSVDGPLVTSFGHLTLVLDPLVCLSLMGLPLMNRLLGLIHPSTAGNSVRHVIHNVTCGPATWSYTAHFVGPASRYASSGLHTTTNNVTRPMLKAENLIMPYIHLPINAIEPTVSYPNSGATNHVCQEGSTLNNKTEYLGSNSGVVRATKKVHSRTELPPDTDDPTVDGNGQKVQESKGFYSDCLLRAIGQTISPVVKLDVHMGYVRRGHFARLMCGGGTICPLDGCRMADEKRLVHRRVKNDGQNDINGGLRFTVLGEVEGDEQHTVNDLIDDEKVEGRMEKK
ncbi:hypothetical protein Gotur_032205 [Gossypium turneri]